MDGFSGTALGVLLVAILGIAAVLMHYSRAVGGAIGWLGGGFWKRRKLNTLAEDVAYEVALWVIERAVDSTIPIATLYVFIYVGPEEAAIIRSSKRQFDNRVGELAQAQGETLATRRGIAFAGIEVVVIEVAAANPGVQRETFITASADTRPPWARVRGPVPEGEPVSVGSPDTGGPATPWSGAHSAAAASPAAAAADGPGTQDRPEVRENAPGRAQLALFEDGELRGYYTLEHGQLNHFGRSPRARIHLSNRFASRWHGSVTVVGDAMVEVADTDSKEGVYVRTKEDVTTKLDGTATLSVPVTLTLDNHHRDVRLEITALEA
jgi:hypothetical protein